jgi:hypothetical protein
MMIAGLVLAGVPAGVLGSEQTLAAADVGTAAVAKVACSCVFVEARDLAACLQDAPPGFEGISVNVDASRRVVTASVLGVISRRAKHTGDFGCTILP